MFWHRPFFPKAFCLQYFLTRCLSVFQHARRGSRQGRHSLRVQQEFSALCKEGRAQRDLFIAWLSMGHSLLLRRHLQGRVCADWALITQEGQPLLPLGTHWSTILLSCPLLLFCLFFFFCLRVLYFFMSVLFTWVLGLVMITISTITLGSVFTLIILQGFSSWTLSQLSNSFLSKAEPRSPSVASPD